MRIVKRQLSGLATITVGYLGGGRIIRKKTDLMLYTLIKFILIKYLLHTVYTSV